MKYHPTIAAIGCALLAINLAEAKTITVDNKEGSVAMYTSVQIACDAADPGDTILIAGSPNPYGNLMITKRLNLVGPGYLLNENGISGITKDGAALSDVTFGLIELSSSNNSSATGLYISFARINVGVNNITYDKCNLYNTSFQGVVSITRSWLASCTLQYPGSSIRNSIFGAFGCELRNGTTASNCVLPVSHYFSSAAGSSISSSIFIAPNSISAASFATQAKGSVTQSLAVGGVGIGGNPTFLPLGNGNISTIAFTSQAFVQGQANDKAFVLAAGSPAIGTGLNGVDMGIFGGVLPYVISGVPSIPRITRFQVPATATSASGLRIEIDAQSF